MTFYCCVRWKLIKGNFSEMESAGQKEELSHSTTGDQLWELTITNPKEKIFNRRFSSECPQQEKIYLPSPRGTQEYPSNPAKEKGSLPWTLTFRQWTFFQNNPSQFTTFLYKIRERNFLFFLVEFAPCLLLQLACPKWQFPCYSWVNPFLLEKSLPLKVNSFKQQE